MYSKLSKLSLFISTAILSQTLYAADKPTQKDEHDIETLIITATPLERTALESATPVSVLNGEALDNQIAPTLGDTLKNVPGVNSSYYGPVSSSPIIRGLNGPRIKIVQNGLDSSDASRVGPDHLVSTEASTATQIEVLRGPATLVYGSGAIGGVVNVVDNRLPVESQEGLSGDIMTFHDTVSNENTISGAVDGGSGNFAVHLDGFDRKTDDYKIPVPAEIGSDDDTGKLTNSAIESSGFTLGTGWVSDNSRVAASYGRLDNQYGIPGEEDVYGKMKQDRYQAAGDWTKLGSLFSELHIRAGYSEYQHSEIEDSEVGTTFKNKSIETRMWLNHDNIAGWKGVTGLHYTRSDFSALGEEAFTPASISDSIAIFGLEEKRVGAFLWQLGARVEQSNINPDNDFFADSEDENLQKISFGEEKFTAVSMSAGTVWSLNENSSLAFNIARAERAPTSAEMFSNGAHIGTSTFEVGAGFNIQAEGGGYALSKSGKSLEKEVANNLDVTYRYNGEHYLASFSVFYNAIDNYLFESNTGLIFNGDDEETANLPIYIFAQQDADLYGFEAELDWHINDTLRLDSFADYTRAKIDNNGDAPRTPPMRLSTSLHWEQDSWHGEFGVTHYFEQDKIASYETQTDSYTLVNASMNYYMSLAAADVTLFLKGNNLTDEEARVHSSFIKDKAPLPGRSLVFGTKVSF